MKYVDLGRREFLKKSALGASALALGATGRVRGAMPDDLNIGFIGVGGRGTTHVRKVSRMMGVRIAAVCDLKTDRIANAQMEAEKGRLKFKPKGYTDFREMLDKEDLDGIIIATEVGNHAKVAVPVLNAGYHTFCEKPLETTVERMDEIVRAARKAKGICQVGFQRHYNVGYVEAIKRIHQGDLGDVSFMQGQWHWSWAIGGHWASDIELGGGEIVEQAGHHMDVMAWVMKYQPPVECVAMANIKRKLDNPAKPIGEDHSATAFKFPNGAIFSYTHLFYCPKAFEAEKMWVYGQEWGVDLVNSVLHQKDKSSEIAESSGTDWGKGTNEELEAFFANIREGGKRTPLSNIETARVATLMCFMSRQAFRELTNNDFRSAVVKWKDLGSKTDPA